MASKRLSFEEAVEELRNPTPGGMLWAWAYDYNPDNSDLWTGMSDNTEPEELDASYGPFIWTDTPSEALDTSVLTDEERVQIHQDMLEDENIVVCPADGDEYEPAYDLNHEMHDSEHPNHHKFCNLASVGHHHEDIPSDEELAKDELQDVLDRGPNDDATLPLSTVRFDPAQAHDRLASFIEIFEGDGITDTTTLKEALGTLGDLVDQTNSHHDAYNGSWTWNRLD